MQAINLFSSLSRRKALASLAFGPLVAMFGCANTEISPEVSPAPVPIPAPKLEPLVPKDGCHEKAADEKSADEPDVPAEEVAASISIGLCRLIKEDTPAVALTLYDKTGKRLMFPLQDKATAEALLAAVTKAMSLAWPAERKV